MVIYSNEVVVDNTVLVDGSAVTQPISATSLPLPAGAATNAAVTALTKPSDTQLVDGSAHTQPVSGTVNVGNFPGTQPVSGTITVQQPTGSNLHVAVDGTVNVLAAVASTSTITQVTMVNNVNNTLLSANVNRKKAILFIATSTIRVKLGAVASTTSFTYLAPVNNTTIEITGWTGQIDAIGSGGVITVTELT